MRIGKACRLCRNDQIASQRQFQRAGIAMSMHRRDHRLRQISQAFNHARLQMRHRQRLTGSQVMQIIAGGKHLPAPRNTTAPTMLRICSYAQDMRLQFQKHLHRQGVHLVRAIQRQGRQPPAPLAW